MRDVDEALARAFAAARPAHEHPHVPPPPHVAPPGASVAVANWPALVLTLERRHGDRFAALADALVTIRDRQHRKLILFTSCHRAEGRTTLVLTLARALARHPGAGRTVLVDTDLTGPMLARVLDLRPTVGLDDVIERGDAVAEAFVTLGDRLTLLPLRAAVPDPRPSSPVPPGRASRRDCGGSSTSCCWTAGRSFRDSAPRFFNAPSMRPCLSVMPR